MKKTITKLIVVIASLIGTVDSGYISYEKLSGAAVKCGPSFDCGTVLDSVYAYIGPIPLSILGMLFYFSVFMLASIWLLEFPLFQKLAPSTLQKFRLKFLKQITIPELLTLLTSAGFIYSVYLVLIMGVVLQSWCLYCLVSAATSSTLFLLMSYFNLRFHHSSYFGIKGAFLWTIGIIYTNFVKPFCFLVDAETIHNFVTSIGETMGRFPLTRKILSCAINFSHPTNCKKLMGINFPGRVGLAAGFDYNGRLSNILSSVGFGWQTIGTVTYEAYEGNPKPRLGRYPNSKALLINKGLKSWGAKKIIQYLLERNFVVPTAISIASTNKLFKNDKEQILDILKSFALFEQSEIKHSLYELNISCPNTFGGEPFTTPKRLEMLLTAIDKLKLSKPVLIKMPIDQSEKETLLLLKIANRHLIDGVIFGNLTKDHTNPAVKPEDRKMWNQVKGNLSGRPTFARSNKLIKLTKKHYGNRFVIVGTGGIFSGKDALEKIDLGADLVQVITGMIFEGPQLISQINRELTYSFLNEF